MIDRTVLRQWTAIRGHSRQRKTRSCAAVNAFGIVAEPAFRELAAAAGVTLGPLDLLTRGHTRGVYTMEPISAGDVIMRVPLTVRPAGDLAEAQKAMHTRLNCYG